MKIAAYETKDYEQSIFADLETEYQLNINYSEEPLTIHNCQLASGCDAVCTQGHSRINTEVLDQLKALGIRYVATRTIGYNHIDIKHANKIGMKVSNSYYEPDGVADYTLMLMLMSLRNCKQAIWRCNVNDYSLNGLQGRQLKDLTVGVIGTGKIGARVIESLQGFGCSILAHDPIQKNKIKKLAHYVELDNLYKKSDIITLHIPLLKTNYHMICQESLAKMKNGVIIINCARGELMHVEDVIMAVENKKIGALGLDVIENEEGIYHFDHRIDIISNKDMAYLRQFPNVIMTQHIAFFTNEAIKSMIKCALHSLIAFQETGSSPYEIKKHY